MLRQVTFAIIAFCFVLGAVSEPVCASGGEKDLITDFKDQARGPLFWFGMAAQSLFLARFLVQWIISEKRKRSTIPTVFWYLSLAGGGSTFLYALLRHEPVFALGQILACVIYTRNLMLIHKHAANRRRSGLPPAALESVTNGDEPDSPD